MRGPRHLTAAGLVLLCSCTSPNASLRLPIPVAPGAPALAPGPAQDPAEGEAARGRSAGLPNRIVIPASYRLIELDGHLALVREADPQELDGSPSAMRIVAGEIARGELAYQPALLPQEVAAQLAADRETAARLDRALDTVMQRSRDLAGQALEIQAQSARLRELLDSAEARIHALEGASTTNASAAKPQGDAAGRN